MLTSEQILSLAVSEPTGGRSGQIEAYRRISRGQDASRGSGFYVGAGGPRHDAVVEAFLDAMGAQPTVASPTKYNHPGQLAQAAPPTPTGVDAQGKPVYAPPGTLTQADYMWIDRLPRDPAAITHQDAVTLAGIAMGMRGKSSFDPDRRLVESVWGPVRDHHDLAAAKVDLANAQRTTAPVPAETVDALAQAIAAETPQLTPGEVRQRADEQLRATVTQREEQRYVRVAQAEARIAELTAAQQAQTAVTV